MSSDLILESTELALIEDLLSRGADERIYTNESGITKYSIPLIHQNIVNRGSCTCSPALGEELENISHILENTNSDFEWLEHFDNLSDRLKTLINRDGENDFELFFAPSGTDLVYFPLLFMRLMHPGKKILNITTCIEELGSGTRFAASAKFYSDYNQFGEEIQKGQNILESNVVSSTFLTARSGNGEVIDNKEAIKSLVDEHKDHIVIMNLVYGSKSGIEDSLRLIDEVQGDNVFWNTDLCQFRHSNSIILKLIEKGSTVMITGSKFYQAPPFCAALMVPNELYQKVADVSDWEGVSSFDSIFSAYDFPKAIREKTNFRREVNSSVILRWSCALKEIEKYNEVPEKVADEKINSWRKTVFDCLENNDAFEIMPFQKDTNKTIISFRVKKNDQYLNYTELKELHRYTVLKDYSFLPENAILFIGQPVRYDDEKSFLRLAIGSKEIREFIKKDEKEFKLDKQIIKALKENISKYNANF